MRLILITFPEFLPDEGELLNCLFDSGLELLHIRKPSYTIEEMENLLAAISPVYYERIVLHDCFELAKFYPIERIHLNSRNPLPPVGLSFKLSSSCHSLNEIKDMDKYEYVFLSPIFNSISKKEYESAFTEQKLIEARQKGIINHKVMALGGICKENIPLIRLYGFGGSAVIGSIWGDYLENHDKSAVLECFKELQKECMYE